jgi:GNAT superfamily N-acetyltransferase
MTEAKTQPGALPPVHPTVVRVDFAREDHRGALLALLDEYACTPEGGGCPLATEVKASLCDVLAARLHYAGWLAFTDGQPVGLINCFEGVSTFRARPLLNVHDIVVTASYRRRGIASTLLRQAELHARATGCCKLTLEVLEGNRSAIAAYAAAGFQAYQLDPAMGRAMFFEKMLR